MASTLRRKPVTKRTTGRGVEAGPDRRAILEAAGRIFVEQGPDALTMRRLAEAAGTSTMVLYTRFGGRDGVLEALLVEGFTLFADALGAVSDADPLRHLRQLGRAYRGFGQAHPTYYRLMWSGTAGPAAPGADCPTPSLAATHGSRAFGSLVFAVTRVLAAADRPAREAEPLAMAVWSAVHGFVSLELAGGIPPGIDVDALYERTLDFVLGGLLAPPSAPPHAA